MKDGLEEILKTQFFLYEIVNILKDVSLSHRYDKDDTPLEVIGKLSKTQILMHLETTFFREALKMKTEEKTELQ